MVILHVRNAFKLGGAELYYAGLVEELASQGAKSVMVTQQPELAMAIRKHGVLVEQVPWRMNSAGRKYLFWGPASVVAYMRLLISHRVNIVNLSGRDAQVFGTVAAKLLRVKVVWTDHGDLKLVENYTGPWQTRLLRHVMKLADKVVFVARAEESEALKRFPELRGKTTVIHNGVKARLFSVARTPSAQPIVFTNARVQQEKGFADLVEAMCVVRDKMPAAKLVVAGGVEDQALLALAKERLGAGFEYLGYKDAAGIVMQLSQCWVYAFPSHSEAFPLSILEAMHSGAAIVATRVGGMTEQLEHNRTGLLVSPSEPQELARAILRLLRDDQLRHRLGQRAKQEASEKYDLEQIVSNQILKLYNSMV